MKPTHESGFTRGSRAYYYPGCALMASARELGESMFQMARLVETRVEELTDWNCCGSSPAHSVSQDYALCLVSRNLLLAERQGIHELFTLCPKCFVNLCTAERTLRQNETQNRKLEMVLGSRYEGTVRIRFFLEGLTDNIDVLKDAITNPLTGLRCALYFGCLLTRPEWITGFDVRPFENQLIELIEMTGVEVVRWGFEKECCGSHLTLTKPEFVNRKVDRIRYNGRQCGAHCLIAFCPLCQVNMELRGKNVSPLPVFYISELIGLAGRVPFHEKWLKRHLVDPRPMLSKLHLI